MGVRSLLIWKSDGTAGQDGNVGPQGSGATLNVTDVTVNSWTSSVDGIPLALVFDSDVARPRLRPQVQEPARELLHGRRDGPRRLRSWTTSMTATTPGWTVRSGTWTVNSGELYQSSTSSNRMLIGYNQAAALTFESKIKITSGRPRISSSATQTTTTSTCSGFGATTAPFA